MRYAKPPSHERALSGREISGGKPSSHSGPITKRFRVVTVADEIILVYKVGWMPNDHIPAEQQRSEAGVIAQYKSRRTGT